MKRWAIAALLLAMVAASPAAAAEATATAAAADNQVLVLLRLPPPHVRPGSDYAGSYGDGAGRAARRRIAAALATRHGLTLVDDWPMPLLGVDCFVMAVPAGRSAGDVAAMLSTASGVAWSQPVNVFETKAAKSPPREDPLFRAQPAAIGWHLADLHRIADGRGVRVAIIDSGVEAAHPDLVGQIQVSANFVANQTDVPEQHGTAVAGIIAAHANNGLGIAGIAPGARLMALRACWQRPSTTICDSFSLAKALYYAVDNRARVINLSLGGPPDPILARLLDVALARGVIVVAAYDRALPQGGFPASHPGVVAVTDDASATGFTRIFVAPGRAVPTTQVGAKWALVDGSSYSAAHVSGLFALLRGMRPRGVPQLVSTSAAGGAIDSCATLRRSGGSGACPERSAELRR